MTEELQALFVVLTDLDRTEELFDILLKCEIRGATIIESSGMGTAISETMPVFGSLRSLLTNRNEHNQTIFAISRYPEKIDKALAMISELFDGFKEPCSGMAFVMPVAKAIGFGSKGYQND